MNVCVSGWLNSSGPSMLPSVPALIGSTACIHRNPRGSRLAGRVFIAPATANSPSPLRLRDSHIL